jgi:hypothetical protein
MRHDSPPAVRVDAAVHRAVEGRVGHALHVGVGEGEDVVEARIPGLEVAWLVI